jgi:hypothetical protein
MRPIRLLRLSAAGVLAATPGAAPRPLPDAVPSVTGIYSDLSYHAATGDLVGMEVFVVAGPGGYYATVQCAGGEPAQPVVVPVRVHAAQLAFTLAPGQPECGTGFSGTVSTAGLRGRFVGAPARRWLPRTRRYWQ